MLTSLDIKKKAKEIGAAVCSIGRIYQETDPQRDLKSILPNAKCIIGFGLAVPKFSYRISTDVSSLAELGAIHIMVDQFFHNLL